MARQSSAYYQLDYAAVAAYYEARYLDPQPIGHEGRGRVGAHEHTTVIDLVTADSAFLRSHLATDDGAPLKFARVASATDSLPTE